MLVHLSVDRGFSPPSDFLHLSYRSWVFTYRCSVGWLPEPCELPPPAPSQHQQMVRISSHAEIDIFQVKLRDVQRKKGIFYELEVYKF